MTSDMDQFADLGLSKEDHDQIFEPNQEQEVSR